MESKRGASPDLAAGRRGRGRSDAPAYHHAAGYLVWLLLLLFAAVGWWKSLQAPRQTLEAISVGWSPHARGPLLASAAPPPSDGCRTASGTPANFSAVPSYDGLQLSPVARGRCLVIYVYGGSDPGAAGG